MSKTDEITVTAFLKSIIESGAAAEDWESELQAAIKVYLKTLRALRKVSNGADSSQAEQE